MAEKARKSLVLLWLPYTWPKTRLEVWTFLIRKNPQARRFGDHQHAWGLRQLSSSLWTGELSSALGRPALRCRYPLVEAHHLFTRRRQRGRKGDRTTHVTLIRSLARLSCWKGCFCLGGSSFFRPQARSRFRTARSGLSASSRLLLQGGHVMRLISIVLSLTALGFASGAIAQSPSIDRKIAQQQNAKGEYAEKAPYRPCPTVASINGRNVCLGCPGRCQWPPSFAK